MLQRLFGLGRLAQTAGKHANPCQAEQGGIFKYALLLKQRIRQGGTEKEGKGVFRQAARVIQFLHEERDIRCEDERTNLMFV